MADHDPRGLGHDWRRFRKTAFEFWGDVCHVCGQPGADTIDHLDPRVHYGTTLPTIDRVRPAHRSCNSSRGAQIQTRPRPSRDW